jgi:hypothetical protein
VIVRVSQERHVFNVRRVRGATEFWDDQQRMDGSLWFSTADEIAFYRTF